MKGPFKLTQAAGLYLRMRRILLIFLSAVLLIVACIWVFIPSKIVVSKSEAAEANKDALLRKLSDTNSWREWWPSESEHRSPNGYFLNQLQFIPGPPTAVSIPVLIADGKEEIRSELTFIRLKAGTTTIQLEAEIRAARFFDRLPSYLKARRIKKSFDEITRSIKNYANTKNLYGYNIRESKVSDSILVFVSDTVNGKPGVAEIYRLVDILRAYIRRHSGVETNYPMLNLYTPDSSQYLIKVAIPVNKRLPDSSSIRYKWMLGGGNILIAEVKGGYDKINDAYSEILRFISDQGRNVPAIPFESLVTDRRRQPDSTQWITRIYYPVM